MINVDFNSETIFFNGQEVGKFYLTDRGRFLVLNQIKINADFRGSGYAQETMEQIINFANDNNKILALTPSSDFGANKNKLIGWYKSLGFIMNKGRNKDYETMELMFKEPDNEVNEVIRREIWTMNENPQQMDKEYTSKGLFTNIDRENVISITNGDPFTKVIANLYAWVQQIEPYSRGQARKNDDDFDRYYKQELIKIYNGLKTYNKNVFPIENFDPANSKEHPIDVWSGIIRRNELIEFFNKIPSTYLRNLKDEIRKPIPIDHYEYYLKNETLELRNFFNKVNQLSDDKREIMMKKIFSSNNKTFADVIQQANNTDVLYLSSDDAEEEVRDKVSALEGEADVLYDQNNIMVVDVKSSDAMKMLGCGSQWCFSIEGGDDHWSNYAQNSHVNLVYNFDEESDSRKRMVVVLPDGEVYDMYNDYMDEYEYLEGIGVDNYINVYQDEMVENITNKIMNEMTENAGFLAFHGSPKEIKNFSDEFVGAEEATDQEGPGIYFTTSFGDSEGYAGNGGYVHTVKLETKKLLDESSSEDVNIESLLWLIKQGEDWEGHAQNWSEDPEAGAMEAAQAAIDYNEKEKDVFVQIWYDFYRYDSISYVRNMVKLGIDGIVVEKMDGEKPANHIIIYNPNVIQIRETEKLVGEDVNEVEFQMQDHLDNAAEDGHIKDGGYASAAFTSSNELVGDDLNEQFYEDYSDISDTDLKASTDFMEEFGDILKPSREMFSKLFTNYLIGSQNINNALKISNNNVKFYNNLMNMQKYFKKFGLIKEDLVYWGVDGDATEDEYKVGAEGLNEDGTALYSSTQGTVEAGDMDWDIDEMISNAKDEVITERVMSWMPKAKSVTVKKKCQLGGNGDGTSTACNQGDMDNVELQDINDDNQHRREANTTNVAEDDKWFDKKINETVTNLMNDAYNTDMIKEADIMSLEDLPFKQEVEGLGGKIFSVGGAVRDKFLGKDSKDLDILITGIPMDKLERLLTKYGRVDAVGESFGVLKFVPQGATDDIDIAIPRTEQKVGDGHKGFDVKSDHELPIEDDLRRRDFTINAIAKDVNGNLIDPYNGQEDLKNKIIRVVNPEAFADDPLRMLRGVQFASRFDFTIEPKTMELIKTNASKIKEIAGERIFIELEKIVNKGDKRVGAQLLKDTGLFQNIFGVELDQSIIDESPFDNVNTMGEFIYLLTRQLDNPAEVFRTTLKGDIPNFKEIEALRIGFDNVSDSHVKNRVVAHNMFSKSPESINSDILPEGLRNAVNDLNSGEYPKSIKELTINGNDLMEIGLKGKEIGDTLKLLIINVYGNKVKNNREDLLKFVNNRNR